MKIKKFIKKKNGIYSIILDNNEELDLYENVILNNNLLITKEINKDNINTILKENRFYSCYFRALKIINARIRSKKEVKDKLLKEGFNLEDVSNSINKLVEEGYINDSYYASAYVNNEVLTTYHGPKRIYSDLKKKGVDDSLINNALLSYDLDMQKEKALKIVSKLNRSNKSISVNGLKRKIYSKLLKDGFTSCAIDYAIENTNFNDDKDIYKKEYDKAYKRLSKKYEGYELECKLKQYLYRKGF